MINVKQKKTIDSFRYWVETNEEKGVVMLPDFLCRRVLEIFEQIQKEGTE